jgi:hypothetical protein
VTTTMRPDGNRRILLPSAVLPRNLAWTEPLRTPLGVPESNSSGELCAPRARCDVDLRFEFDAMVFDPLRELESESLVAFSDACLLVGFCCVAEFSSGPSAGCSGLDSRVVEAICAGELASDATGGGDGFVTD